MEFKAAEGPWRKIFQGDFEKHELEIQMSDKSVLMVVIYEKEGDETKGFVVGGYKAFACVGELENFISSLPRDALVLEKHSKGQTIKYLLLASEPVYIRNEEEEFHRETDKILLQIKNSSSLMQDVAKAYDLQLVELSKADAHVKSAFFSQTLLTPILASAQFKGESELEKAFKEEVKLGLTMDRTKVIESLHLFTKTFVVLGNEMERNHVLHIIAEGALQSNVPAVIFDWKNSFWGLAEGTKDSGTLKGYDEDAEPFGFPVKGFEPGNEIAVDLNNTNVNGLLALFGINDENIIKLVEEVMRKNKIENTDDLARKIKLTQLEGNYSEFEVAKAVRIVKLIGMIYPKFFDGNNDIAAISKNWLQAIGRAGIVAGSNLDNRQVLLLCHNVVKGVFEFYKARGRRTNMVSYLIIPEAEKILHRENQNILATEILNCLSEMDKYGVGFAVAAQNELDLRDELHEMAEAKVSIVEENDVSVQLKGRKMYRVILRPGFSNCSEKNIS